MFVVLPSAQRPSNASHKNGFNASASLKLTAACSGRFPFNAMVPDLHLKAASSGILGAVRDAAWVVRLLVARWADQQRNSHDAEMDEQRNEASSASLACLCLPNTVQHFALISKQPLHSVPPGQFTRWRAE